jgi:RNA polymerase sigma-70 factor (ECF subfamily)
VIADAEAAELQDERRAILRAQAGDPRALEPVLARHAESLFSSVILPRVGDRALAEDVVRDTFVAALEKIGAFRWQGRSIFFWLRQIALNRLIDLHRQRGRAARLVDALSAEAALAPAEMPADEALIAEQDRRRAWARIEAALAALPERYARAVRLRLVEERPREACAAALEVELGNFDVILFRALRAFRKAYGDRE